MSLAFSLTIPANTPITLPANVSVVFNPMLVKTIDLTFPSGCAGLVGGRFSYLSAQLFPWNHGAWYVADGRSIHLEPRLWLDTPPFVLTLTGYNLDELYSHTLYAEIDAQFQYDTLNEDNRIAALGLSTLGRPG